MVVSRKGGWSAAMRNLTVSSRDAPYLHIHDRPREALPDLGWGHSDAFSLLMMLGMSRVPVP